ncbi:hypothetical protein CC1G_06164 [Coprinopsis cinerea okayama7|uniref:Uncharacterized protein n=1 Tax=Coprinopsis cinerea (strain Okayama-7 / 130 / ATCC MYA-4618 / FGSC 9003) TaxID=240176 RepID=A8NV14_COPC7|nr:hypothetical protein CC1G_06164 [Coprinopsis cinerea okayama7\|eukprot:XP_001836577.1 hypothetical protein CC1G_06164 [Coprinopsis cinerea okayama7\
MFIDQREKVSETLTNFLRKNTTINAAAYSNSRMYFEEYARRVHNTARRQRKLSLTRTRQVHNAAEDNLSPDSAPSQYARRGRGESSKRIVSSTVAFPTQQNFVPNSIGGKPDIPRTFDHYARAFPVAETTGKAAVRSLLDLSALPLRFLRRDLIEFGVEDEGTIISTSAKPGEMPREAITRFVEAFQLRYNQMRGPEKQRMTSTHCWYLVEAFKRYATENSKRPFDVIEID